jgi:putative transposase
MANSLSMDETQIKVRGKWTYHYHAVDWDGQTLDFMLSERHDLAAPTGFLNKLLPQFAYLIGWSIYKSGANLTGLRAVNVILKFGGSRRLVTIRQVKHLNNILEQDHRFTNGLSPR